MYLNKLNIPPKGMAIFKKTRVMATGQKMTSIVDCNGTGRSYSCLAQVEGTALLSYTWGRWYQPRDLIVKPDYLHDGNYFKLNINLI